MEGCTTGGEKCFLTGGGTEKKKKKKKEQGRGRGEWSPNGEPKDGERDGNPKWNGPGSRRMSKRKGTVDFTRKREGGGGKASP